MSLPGKQKGYRGEITARDELRRLGLAKLERTGSVAYHKDAADLVQLGAGGATVRVVATQDDRQPMLYTLTAHDLRLLLDGSLDGTLHEIPAAVQVKKRKATWVGSLYRGLKAATS